MTTGLRQVRFLTGQEAKRTSDLRNEARKGEPDRLVHGEEENSVIVRASGFARNASARHRGRRGWNRPEGCQKGTGGVRTQAAGPEETQAPKQGEAKEPENSGQARYQCGRSSGDRGSTAGSARRRNPRQLQAGSVSSDTGRERQHQPGTPDHSNDAGSRSLEDSGDRF